MVESSRPSQLEYSSAPTCPKCNRNDRVRPISEAGSFVEVPQEPMRPRDPDWGCILWLLIPIIGWIMAITIQIQSWKENELWVQEYSRWKKALDAYGEEGWELAAISGRNDGVGRTSWELWVFKRPQ